jgi:isoleucyl-tRNA synthetase
MKQLAAMLTSLDQETIFAFEAAGFYDLNVEGNEIHIESSDVEFISEDIPGWLVASEGRLTVALEVEISEALRSEGIARELVNRIQNIRKDQQFEITDRISIELSHHQATDAAVQEYASYIASQTLADSLQLCDAIEGGIELNLDEVVLTIKVSKR